MDMYETAKEIRQLTREKRYRDVVKIADRLNLDKVTSGLMILDIVEAYENQGDRKAARDALLAYYDSHGITGRNMMQKLIELCVETGDINNAVALCLQFENSWPDSSISFLMRYQIAQAAGESLETQISYLEKYRAVEFEERWGYELAKLYDRNNQREKCAKTCHDLICFFGHGKYVEKAARLKSRVGGLTDDEERAIADAYSKEAEEKQAKEEAVRLAKEAAKEQARKAEEERLARVAAMEAENAAAAAEEAENNIVYVNPDEDRKNNRGFSSASFGTNADAWEADKARLRRSSYGVGTSTPVMEEVKSPEPVEMNRVQEAQAEKLRQTEEAARKRKEQKEAELKAKEEKLSQAIPQSDRPDRYSQVEKYSATELMFSSIKRQNGIRADEVKSRKSAGESNGFFQTFGKVASGIRQTFQSDDGDVDTIDSTDTDIEYITAGRESATYLADIENRILSELDMVDDEQLDSLSTYQIKELYELKMHRKLRDTIADLLKDCKTGTLPASDEITRFTEENPYVNELFEDIPDAEYVEEGDDSVNGHTGAETVKENSIESSKDTPDAASDVVSDVTGKEGKEEESGSAWIEVIGRRDIDASEETASAVTEVPSETVAESPSAKDSDEIAATETVDASPAEEETEKESEKAENVEAAAAATAPENTAEESRENTDKEDKAKSIISMIGKYMFEDDDQTEESSEENKQEEKSDSSKENADDKKAAKEEESSSEQEENADAASSEAVEEEEPTILDEITDPDESLPTGRFRECVIAHAKKKKYIVDVNAYMTIAVLAEQMQEAGTALSSNNAEKMVDIAIERLAKSGPLGKFFGKYSKNYAVTLRDRHFDWK